LHRIVHIHQQLRAGRYPNVPRLAALFEVNERTVRRDLQYLREMCNAPLEFDHQRRGFYYAEDFELPPMRLSEGELLALFVGARILAEYQGTPFSQPLSSALAKLAQFAPGTITVDLQAVSEVVSFQVEPLRGEAEAVARAFRQLEQAIVERRRVLVEYYSAYRDEITLRRFDPYCLRNSGGVWYVIGHCREREALRTFALDRILTLELLEDRFEVPESFDLRRYLETAWRTEVGEPVPVAVRFDAYQARWIRGKRWHPSQQVEETPDGGVIVRFIVGGLGELKRWVLQFGGHAEVLEPEWLRAQVAQEFRAATGLYAAGPTATAGTRQSAARSG